MDDNAVNAQKYAYNQELKMCMFHYEKILILDAN